MNPADIAPKAKHPDEIVERLASAYINADALYSDILLTLPEGADREAKLTAIEDLLGDARESTINAPARTLRGIRAKARTLRRVMATNSDRSAPDRYASDNERLAWSIMKDIEAYSPESERADAGATRNNEPTARADGDDAESQTPQEAVREVVDDLAIAHRLLNCVRMATESLGNHEEDAICSVLGVVQGKIDEAMSDLAEAVPLPS